MSARERLYAAVMQSGPHSPDRSERASALIDAFARELAEKIRADIIPEEQLYTREAQAGADAMRDAADLIDPTEEGDRGQQ